jgi:two-component system sensor histidine kinase BaeS
MTADIAHELRTPLTNIQGYLEAILDGLVEPDTKTISDLHEQTVHLSRLVDDLRLLSVAEAGALRLEVSPDSLESVIRDSAKTFEPRAIELGIELCISAEKQLPPVDLDRTRMRQVAVNLIENALHHTPPGGRVSIDLANDASGGVRMTISDTGRGIKPEELPRIFDQFYRVDASRSRATGGAGLGLTIVKRLVEAHNGAISVVSTPGKGTCFIITLPRSASPAAA